MVTEKINHILSYRKDLPLWLRKLLFWTYFKTQSKTYGNSSMDVTSLRERGHLQLSSKKLDKTNCDLILDFLSKCGGKEKISSQGTVLKKTYHQRSLLQNDLIVNLATDRDVLQLASDYFGSQPRIAYLASWTTFADDESEVGEMSFHMDHHGHKFLKLFYYLTPVLENSGHHEYIAKTTDQIVHGGLLRQWKTHNKELYADYCAKMARRGKHKMSTEIIKNNLSNLLVKQTGEAGTCFIEDTSGLHRGTPIKDGKPRTILQVLYTSKVHKKDMAKEIDLSNYANPIFSNLREVFSESYTLGKQ